MLHATRTMATILLILAVYPARAADFVEHSHEEMRKGVEQFVIQETTKQGLEDVRVDVGNLDYRLKVHKCALPLNFSIPHQAKFSPRVTVEVACNDKEPWRLYLQSQITAFRNVVVSRAPILRNQVIGGSDIGVEKREISAVNHGYFTNPEQVAGKISRLNLQGGAIIMPRNLMVPKLVKRGDLVIILAESSGIQVRMSGKALNDAIKGGRVRVMNDRTRRVVEGSAIERGVVQVSM